MSEETPSHEPACLHHVTESFQDVEAHGPRLQVSNMRLRGNLVSDGLHTLSGAWSGNDHILMQRQGTGAGEDKEAVAEAAGPQREGGDGS